MADGRGGCVDGVRAGKDAGVAGLARLLEVARDAARKYLAELSPTLI